IEVNKIEKNDTNKVNAILDFCFNIKYYDAKLTYEYTQKALSLAQDLNYTKGQAEGYKTLGILADLNGKYSQSVDYYLLSIKFYQKNNDEMGIAKSEGNIGMILRKL